MCRSQDAAAQREGCWLSQRPGMWRPKRLREGGGWGSWSESLCLSPRSAVNLAAGAPAGSRRLWSAAACRRFGIVANPARARSPRTRRLVAGATPTTMNLLDIFDSSLLERRDEVALEWQGRSFTFGDIEERSNRTAHVLRARGFRKGD